MLSIFIVAGVVFFISVIFSIMLQESFIDTIVGSIFLSSLGGFVAFLLVALISGIASTNPNAYKIVETKEIDIANDFVVAASISQNTHFICQVRDESTGLMTTKEIPASKTVLNIISTDDQAKIIKYKHNVANPVLKFFTIGSLTEKTSYSLYIQEIKSYN